MIFIFLARVATVKLNSYKHEWHIHSFEVAEYIFEHNTDSTRIMHIQSLKIKTCQSCKSWELYRLSTRIKILRFSNTWIFSIQAYRCFFPRIYVIPYTMLFCGSVRLNKWKYTMYTHKQIRRTLFPLLVL